MDDVKPVHFFGSTVFDSKTENAVTVDAPDGISDAGIQFLSEHAAEIENPASPSLSLTDNWLDLPTQDQFLLFQYFKRSPERSSFINTLLTDRGPLRPSVHTLQLDRLKYQHDKLCNTLYQSLKGALENPKTDIWEKRLKVSLFHYLLTDAYADADKFTSPVANNMLTSMTRVYRSNIFDTDNDGVVDDDDDFPFNSIFSSDQDHDQIPDPIDANKKDEKIWAAIEDGKTYEINQDTLTRSNFTRDLYRTWKEGEKIFLEKEVYLQFSAEIPTQEQDLFKKRWQTAITQTLSPKDRITFKMRLVFSNLPHDKTATIRVYSAREAQEMALREDSSHVQIQSKNTTLAHEAGHLFGLPDRYEEYDSDRDLSLYPAKKHVLTRNTQDIMTCPSNRSYYRSVDLKMIVLNAVFPELDIFESETDYVAKKREKITWRIF